MNDLFDGPALSEVPDDEPNLSRAQKRELREARRRAAKRRRRAMIAVVVALAVIGVGGWFAWTRGADFFSGLSGFGASSADTSDFPGPGVGSVQVTVAPGAAGSAIGDALVAEGVVASRGAFVAAYTANENASRIQPGTYNLLRGLPAAEAVTMLLDLNNRADALVDLRPGYSVDTIVTQLAKATGHTEDEFRDAMADTAATGLPAEAVAGVPEGHEYEGWLAPKQYQFGVDTTPTEMIAEMVATQVERLDALGVAPGDRQTVLTKASIVEREAGRAEDRPLVASVVENRLAKGMKLQMDSTVHYVIGGSSDATTSAKDLATESPYNTYKYAGLPPSAIASPSESSIQAVLDHVQTDYLYFVTINLDTGETRFAVTDTEHMENVKLFRQWTAENPR